MSPELDATNIQNTSNFNVQHDVEMPDDIRMPGQRKKPKYPFRFMRIGDSFFIGCPIGEQEKKITAIKTAANHYSKKQSSANKVKLGHHCRNEGGVEGIRFWRVDVS